MLSLGKTHFCFARSLYIIVFVSECPANRLANH